MERLMDPTWQTGMVLASTMAVWLLACCCMHVKRNL